MDINFKGKRALVTGAGKGIGRSTAKMLVECGAEVIALSRTQADLHSLKEEAPTIQTICIDLSDIEAAVKKVNSLGDIDLLVNNAGIALLDPFEEIKMGDFDKIFSVNVKAPLFIAQAVSKRMIAKGSGGAIVNVSSQASMIALKDHTLYCSTKAAMDMFTKTMALELGPYKIRVNAVNPTVVMTDMGRIGWSDPAKAKPMLDTIPLGRFAEVEDVVHAILYLLSDKAGMVNGTMLPIDGGRLVQ